MLGIFVSTTNNYTITWQDDTGAIIATDTWAYGTIPSHSSPTKRSDGQYTYTFSRWTPSIDIVTGNTTYTAVYYKEPIPTPTPAPAASSWPIGRSFTVIANNNNKNRIYNLRSGPGTDNPKIGDIKQGESYEILDCQHGNTEYDWLKFQRGGTEYWVNSGVVDVDGHGFGIINGKPRFP